MTRSNSEQRHFEYWAIRSTNGRIDRVLKISMKRLITLIRDFFEDGIDVALNNKREVKFLLKIEIGISKLI